MLIVPMTSAIARKCVNLRLFNLRLRNSEVDRLLLVTAQRILWGKKLRLPFQSLAVCIWCLECGEKRIVTIGLLYRVGGPSVVGILSLLDSEGWISCSTESFLAVPSNSRRFCIIMKPLEAISSIFLQGNDAKCHSTAPEEGSIVGRFLS